MGIQSDGVFYATQQTAWPALLAHQAFANKFTIPLLQGPGCYSPLIAPLQFQKRLSSATYPSILPSDQVCALLGTIPLPTNNVAIDGADDLRRAANHTRVDRYNPDDDRQRSKEALVQGGPCTRQDAR